MTDSVLTSGGDCPERRRKVVVIVGTRPEAIKMAPVVTALQSHPESFDTAVVSTGQHRELLNQAFETFGFGPDIDLDLMQADQSITGFAARAMAALDGVYSDVRPDVVLVQGDTATVFVAAIAARFHRLEVGHVEAGLRSFDDDRPFPEEINRRGTAAMATYHFAPTAGARENLLREGIANDRIHLTGNTVVDALATVELDGDFQSPPIRQLPLGDRRMLLVTAHRRESHGGGLEEICSAILTLARQHPEMVIVFPVHPNPNVRATVDRLIGDHPRIFTVPPVGYADMLRLLRRSTLVLSDSGGIQEEAPSFARPLLILRDVTERPEVVDAGAAQLVGTSRERIVREANRLLSDPYAYQWMASAGNPFGDGRAAERIAQILLGQRVDEPRLPTRHENHPLTPRSPLSFFSRSSVQSQPY